MGQFVGLDVSVKETSVCVVNDAGAVLHESKVRSTPRAIAGVIRSHAPEAGRIGLEAGGASSWLCRELIEAGLPVIHMDARHAHRALSMRLNKTDRNDARGLADLMRVGWFKPAHPKTAPSHRLRSTLLARKRLVDIRRHMENQLRNIIKTSGAVLGSTAGRGLLRKVEAACATDASLVVICQPLMEVIKTVRAQAAVYDRLLRSMARRDATARRMMTVPGIGVMTALAFMSTVDDPHRFRRSSDVGPFLGLTPRRHQSGEMGWSGRISKQGDGLVRTYLYEAASVLISKISRWSKLKEWGMLLARTSGHGKARIAVARKMAVILHCIWVDGTEFDWGDPAAA